jgi:hypothetical protein
VKLLAANRDESVGRVVSDPREFVVVGTFRLARLKEWVAWLENLACADRTGEDDDPARPAPDEIEVLLDLNRLVARPAAGSATEFVVVCGLRVEEGIEAQVIRW